MVRTVLLLFQKICEVPDERAKVVNLGELQFLHDLTDVGKPCVGLFPVIEMFLGLKAEEIHCVILNIRYLY